MGVGTRASSGSVLPVIEHLYDKYTIHIHWFGSSGFHYKIDPWRLPIRYCSGHVVKGLRSEAVEPFSYITNLEELYNPIVHYANRQRRIFARFSLEIRSLSYQTKQNKLALCKRALRLQIGDRDEAMEERQRLGGLYNQSGYWKYSKCEFGCRMFKNEKGRKSYDIQLKEADGIRIRWESLSRATPPR